MKRYAIFGAALTAGAVAASLLGCGGGGIANGLDVQKPSPTQALMMTPKGSSCVAVSNPEILSTMVFETAQPINAKPWGCLLVDAADSQPVLEGGQSLRFEVRPDDCSANSGFNDCQNDRSRHEINEAGVGATEGKVLTWEENIFIPTQPRFRPQGGNIMFLTQINFVDSTNYGTLAYVEVAQNGSLMIRTHVGLTFQIAKQYVVYPNPADKWIKFKFVVKSTAKPDGYVQVFVDDQLMVHETRQTLPSSTAVNWLKIGIYNAYKSAAVEPYETQVVYYGKLKKTVASF